MKAMAKTNGMSRRDLKSKECIEAVPVPAFLSARPAFAGFDRAESVTSLEEARTGKAGVDKL
jgi:hypothetical protein